MNNTNPVDITSLILQALSLQILFRDYNNSDLMQELQKQDKEYLEKIIQNQQRILQLLGEGDSDGRRKENRN